MTNLAILAKKIGFWLEEFAAPYYVLTDAGAEVTLASPKGGPPPLDPKSDADGRQTCLHPTCKCTLICHDSSVFSPIGPVLSQFGTFFGLSFPATTIVGHPDSSVYGNSFKVGAKALAAISSPEQRKVIHNYCSKRHLIAARVTKKPANSNSI